jgi:hypothetical protein
MPFSRVAQRRYWSGGVLVSLLGMFGAMRLALPLSLVLVVGLAAYLLGVWLFGLLGVFGQYGRSQTSALLTKAPTTREWAGMTLGVVGGLLLGTAVVAAANPTFKTQLAVVLTLVGAWAGRWLVHLPARLKQIKRPQWRLFAVVTAALPSVLLSVSLAVAGIIISLLVLFLSQFEAGRYGIGSSQFWQKVLFWTVSSGGVGYFVGWLLMLIHRYSRRISAVITTLFRTFPFMGTTVGGSTGLGLYMGQLYRTDASVQAQALSRYTLTLAIIGLLAALWLRQLTNPFWRRVTLWGLLGTAVMIVYFAWFPLPALTMSQMVLASTGAGTIISLVFIRPSLTTLLRSIGASLLGLVLVSANVNLAIARTSALLGLFLGMMVTLIVLNWLLTTRT